MPSRAMFSNKGLITAPWAAPRGVGLSISASTYPPCLQPLFHQGSSREGPQAREDEFVVKIVKCTLEVSIESQRSLGQLLPVRSRAWQCSVAS